MFLALGGQQFGALNVFFVMQTIVVGQFELTVDQRHNIMREVTLKNILSNKVSTLHTAHSPYNIVHNINIGKYPSFFAPCYKFIVYFLS